LTRLRAETLEYPFEAVLAPQGDEVLLIRGRLATLCDVYLRPRAALRGHDASIHAAVFLGDDQHVATLGGDGTVRVWSRHEAELATQPVHVASGYQTYASFSPDGRYAAPHVQPDP